MTTPPPWLGGFQAEFAALLRQEPSGGPMAPPAVLLAATAPGPRWEPRERLAVYHRQYWLRLVFAIGHEFRLTAGLLGGPQFQRCALDFLRAHPPRRRDLAALADGFDRFASREARQQANAVPGLDLPRSALEEALGVDQAFREVFRAPEVARWSPALAELSALGSARLQRSPAVALVRERFPLLQLRHGLPPPEAGAAALALPAPHEGGAVDWALLRTPAGQRLWRLSPLQGRLYQALTERTVAEALAELEAECPVRLRGRLQARVTRYLAEGVAAGLWCGLVDKHAEAKEGS